MSPQTGEPIKLGRVTYGTVWSGQTLWQRCSKQKFEEGSYHYVLGEDGESRLRLEAEGYLPFESQLLVHDSREPLVLDVKLSRADLQDVIVYMPDGQQLSMLRLSSSVPTRR